MSQRLTDTRPNVSAYDRLLDAASLLFYNDGIAATGIDAVVSEAGVAKKSLYNNFASKSALVLAYLKRRHEDWCRLYENRLEKANSPQERLLSVFDAYLDHADLSASTCQRGFRGCGALNASAELQTDEAGRKLVRSQKEEIEGLLSIHLKEVMAADNAQVASKARQLSFLLEGAVMRAGLEGHNTILKEARQMAINLVKMK